MVTFEYMGGRLGKIASHAKNEYSFIRFLLYPKTKSSRRTTMERLYFNYGMEIKQSPWFCDTSGSSIEKVIVAW